MSDAAPAPVALLVDDHLLLTQSLALALAAEGVEARIADLDAPPEAFVSSVLADPPDMVLLDLDLGGVLGDGAALVGPLTEAGCRVLVVSASSDEEQLGRAVEQGAVGVVAKSAPFAELVASALATARGEGVLSGAERGHYLQRVRSLRSARDQRQAPFRRLTEREDEVLRALADGCSVAVIAARWFVSEATVRSQVRAVLTKLGVSSQLQAVALAHEVGWLTGPGHGGRTRC